MKLKYQPEKYRSLENAKSSLTHKVKPCWTIMLGDDMKFWVVCLADAQRLAKAGYEYAI